MTIKTLQKSAFVFLLIIAGPTFAQVNFLVGLCDISAAPKDEPVVTSCSVPDLAARPVWSTGVQIYKQNSMTYMLIWGSKNRSSPSGGQPNQVIDLNARYQVVDANTVIATISTPNGCTMPEKFIRSGSTIFKEVLPPSGNCGENQIRSIQDQIKAGRVRVNFIK
jgi:hypothetical protein